MDEGQCATVQDAVTYLKSHGSAFCQGVGEWAEYFLDSGRISGWDGWIGSHSHEGPGDGENDTIQMNDDDLPANGSGDFGRVVATLTHEVIHSNPWGVTHDTNPNNFDLGACAGNRS